MHTLGPRGYQFIKLFSAAQIAIPHIAPKQHMRPKSEQNLIFLFSPRDYQVPSEEPPTQTLFPNQTRLLEGASIAQTSTRKAGTLRNSRGGARRTYLLAGERRGEEVDAVGAAPERLLFRRQRLRGGGCGGRRPRGAVHLHGPRSGDGGGPRDPRPLPRPARRSRRGKLGLLAAGVGG